MRIGNVKPPRGFLKRLGERIDNDSFTSCAVDWPETVLEVIRGAGLFATDWNSDGLIGGKMSRHVIQHTDSCRGVVSVVWFAKLNKDLLFCVGDRSDTVYSGDIYMFDHNIPHSVCAVERTTGTWYFMAEDFNRNECNSSDGGVK